MLSKYGMTLSALGFAEELRADGIASNALWPRTLIATAAVKNLLGGQDRANRGRTVEIMADAAYEILTKPAAEYSGNTAIDDEILSAAGLAEFERYRVVPGSKDLELDIFLD